MNLESRFEKKLAANHILSEHLQVLRYYGQQCEHITETGINEIISAWAFLVAHPVEVVSYGQKIDSEINDAEFLAAREGVSYRFFEGDTAQVSIVLTDLLFINSVHSYNHLQAELVANADKVKKYLIFHGTTMFSNEDETGGGLGIWPAIEAFLAENTAWQLRERFTNGLGLTVLQHE